MGQMWYISPNGVRIDLVKPGDWSRRIAYAGINGLVGKKTASVSTAVDVPGQRVTGFRTIEMTGSLNLTIVSGAEGSAENLHSELVREFDAELPGTLFVERESTGVMSTRVRLNGEIAWPDSWLGDGDEDLTVSVPLVSDDGVWETATLGQAGTVDVVNAGDVFIYPWLAWSDNVTVTLPSGVVVPLAMPADGQPRRLSLDPYTSHEVLHQDGTVDEIFSAVTAGLLLGEGVPRRETRRYITTGGALIEYTLKYLNPWR